MSKAPLLCLTSFLALTTCLSVSALADSDEVRITGPSPFANCTADNVAGQDGENYPGAEVEPYVAANPRNQNNLIAVWQQDRWSNGGSRGLVAGTSFDGGRSWSPSILPGSSKCTGGPFERSTDPWIAISPNGTAYFMALSFMNDITCADGTVISAANAMTVSKSINGGRTWGPPTNLVLDNDGQLFNDKNAITADPYNSRYVYATWDKLITVSVPSTCEVASAQPLLQRAALKSQVTSGGHRDGVETAREKLRNKRRAASLRSAVPAAPISQDTGPSYFSRTTDGGQTWEPEKVIFEPGGNAQTIGNLIEVTPNGHLYNFFTHILADGSVRLSYVKSADKGATFGSEVVAAEMNITATGSLTPDTEEIVRDGNTLFDSAVDPMSGNLYLVWQDGRQGDLDKVAFTMSVDGGVRWTEPVFISKTPRSRNPLREQSFIPSVEVDNEGKVIVTYYDFRNDRNDGREATDLWSIQCESKRGTACANPRRWEDEKRLTVKSFDMLDAPEASGLFLGDYQGLTRAGSKVIAVYGKTVAKNVNDMFFRRVD